MSLLAVSKSHCRGKRATNRQCLGQKDAKMWIRIEDQPGGSPICNCRQIGIHSANPPRTKQKHPRMGPDSGGATEQ